MSSIAANDENLTYYIPQDSEVPQLRTPTMKMVMMIPSPKQWVVQKKLAISKEVMGVRMIR